MGKTKLDMKSSIILKLLQFNTILYCKPVYYYTKN
jgi:hypothetical protein